MEYIYNLELGKFFYLLKKDAGKEPISLAVEFAQAADEAIAEATLPWV